MGQRADADPVHPGAGVGFGVAKRHAAGDLEDDSATPKLPNRRAHLSRTHIIEQDQIHSLATGLTDFAEVASLGRDRRAPCSRLGFPDGLGQ